MNKFLDITTTIIKRSADLALVKNPIGTSYGTFTGVALEGLLKFISPALQNFKDVIDLQQVKTFHYIAFGIVIFNLRTFMKRHPLPQEIEDAFEAIRRSKNVFSTVQVRLQYLALLSAVIARTKIKEERISNRRSSKTAISIK